MTYENMKDIRTFIGRYVTNRVQAGQLVNQVGDDKDFYIITAKQCVNDEVKAAIKKFDSEDTANRDVQYVLDGLSIPSRRTQLSAAVSAVLFPLNK